MFNKKGNVVCTSSLVPREPVTGNLSDNAEIIIERNDELYIKSTLRFCYGQFSL